MAITGGNIAFTGYQQPDYSGVVQAAGLPMQAIGQGIEDFEKASQERKKLDAETKATRSGIESAIKLGDALGFDVKGMLSPVLAQMDDPNTTPMQAAALGREAANQISNVLNLGFKAQEFDLQKQELAMRKDAFNAERNAPIAPNYKLVELPVIVNGVPRVMKVDRNPETGIVRRLDGKMFRNVQDAASGTNPIGEGSDVSIDLPEFNSTGVESGPGVLLELNGAPTLTAEAQALADALGAGEGGLIDGEPTIGLPIQQDQARVVQAGLDIAPTSEIPGLLPEESQANETYEQNVQAGGLLGQRNTKTKEFKAYPGQTGGRITRYNQETGEFEIIEGSAAGAGAIDKLEKAAQASKEQSFERSRAIIGSAAKTIPEIQSVLSANPFIAWGQTALATVLPASESGRIQADLETIRVQTSKEEVGRMRASSPTGSAGGQITEKEWPKFENRFGKMEVGMYPPDLVSNIQKTALNQFESINGTPEDVVKLFNDGKISKPVFDEYIKEYRETRSMLKIPDSGVVGPGNDWTKYSSNLLRFDKQKQRQLDPKAQEMQERLDAINRGQ